MLVVTISCQTDYLIVTATMALPGGRRAWLVVTAGLSEGPILQLPPPVTLLGGVCGGGGAGGLLPQGGTSPTVVLVVVWGTAVVSPWLGTRGGQVI